MPRGKVIFFNTKNKFGFIKDESGDPSYYVREKSLMEPIQEGDLVEFDLKESKRGPEAVNVKKAPGKPSSNP